MLALKNYFICLKFTFRPPFHTGQQLRTVISLFRLAYSLQSTVLDLLIIKLTVTFYLTKTHASLMPSKHARLFNTTVLVYKTYGCETGH